MILGVLKSYTEWKNGRKKFKKKILKVETKWNKKMGGRSFIITSGAFGGTEHPNIFKASLKTTLHPTTCKASVKTTVHPITRKASVKTTCYSRVDGEGGQELGPGDGWRLHRLETLVVPVVEPGTAVVFPAEVLLFFLEGVRWPLWANLGITGGLLLPYCGELRNNLGVGVDLLCGNLGITWGNPGLTVGELRNNIG